MPAWPCSRKRDSPLSDPRPERTAFDPVLAAAAAVSVMGVAAFAYLFLRDLTLFWIVLSPVIFVVYQLPAVALFKIARKRREKRKNVKAVDLNGK